MSKISNLDVLYSVIVVNTKLDTLARDIVHTRSIEFIGTTSGDRIHSLSDKILNRFCENILPQIHKNIECFTLESSSMCRIFHSTNYPKLFKLILRKVDLEFASRYFKEQILHLVVAVIDNRSRRSLTDVVINVCMRIFNLFTSITHIDFVVKNDYRYPPFSFYDLPSTGCSSSTIVHLSIRLVSLEHCLCLLDGCLNQLHTFIVEIYHIDPLIDGHLDDTIKLLLTFKIVFFLRLAVQTTN